MKTRAALIITAAALLATTTTAYAGHIEPKREPITITSNGTKPHTEPAATKPAHVHTCNDTIPAPVLSDYMDGDTDPATAANDYLQDLAWHIAQGYCK